VSPRLLLAASAACLLLSRPVHAQATLEVDHATGRVRLISPSRRGADTTEAVNGGILRVRPGLRVEVRVVGTNTALYHHSQATERVEQSQMDPVRSFLAPLRPLLPGVVAGLVGAERSLPGQRPSMLPELTETGPEAIRKAAIAGRRVELNLARIDEAVHGPAGLNRGLTMTLLTLERMRTGAAVEPAARALADTLGLPVRPCEERPAGRWKVTTGLLETLDDLVSARRELATWQRESRGLLATGHYGGLADSLELLNESSGVVVDGYEGFATAAYRVEALATQVAAACAQWTGGSVELRAGARAVVSVTIEPRADPEIARVADPATRGYEVTLVPDRLVQPTLGATMLYAPGATYSRYGTRNPGDGTAQVYRRGSADERFGYGVTLGVTWRGLGASAEGRPERALWLPEVTVDPRDDVRALGVGAAASWSFVKVGVGVVWIRHRELVGQRVGDIIGGPELLRADRTYRSPKVYLSLGVFGMPGLGS
jgi:hypothetical protein